MSALVDDDLFHRRVTVSLQQVALNVVHTVQQLVHGGLIAVIELGGQDRFRLLFESATSLELDKSSSDNTRSSILTGRSDSRSVVQQRIEWNFTNPRGSLPAVAGLRRFQVVENHLSSRHCSLRAHLLHSESRLRDAKR